MKQLIKIATISTLSLFAYGCSSSDGDDTPSTPDGIYSGKITGGETSLNGTHEKAVIYNNMMYMLSEQVEVAPGIDVVSQINDAELIIDGDIIIGRGTRYDYSGSKGVVDYDGSFSNTSVNLDFEDGFNPSSTIKGSVNLTKNTSLYNRGSASSTIATTWTEGNNNFKMSISIDSSGNFTGQDNDGLSFCTYSGSITPVNTNINLYKVTLNSTSTGTCIGIPTATYSGYAWTEGSSDETLNIIVTGNSGFGRAAVLTRN